MEEACSVRVWEDLGVVETIYEEEAEEDFSPVISSPPAPAPPSPLRSLVDSWSVCSGREPDVVIHVQDSIFFLHKAPLIAKSSYLKRLLRDSTEITLSPPLNITAETFSLVTEFCYGAHILITPFNIAALRVAVHLLDMPPQTTASASASADNLLLKTEAYFRRIIAVNREHAAVVLNSSLSLLPESETTACLVTRCIEALSSMDKSDENGVLTSLDEIIKLSPENFHVIVESMNQRFTNHDILYRIVDLYLKEQSGNINEEQKVRISNYIDCTTLSPQILMHAVQNPRMPLRFVVQAMFVQQLNTRQSIFSAADHQSRRTTKHQNQQIEDSATLGAILERDAALRQVAQMKDAMNTTNSRIQSLEKQLKGMRKLLHDQPSEKGTNVIDSGRSQSFRFSSQNNNNKIERGERGSVSSANLRFNTANKDSLGGYYSSSEEEFIARSPIMEKKYFSRRLIDGLKNAFRVSKKKSESSNSSKFRSGDHGEEDMKYEGENNLNVIVIKKKLPFHQSGPQV